MLPLSVAGSVAPVPTTTNITGPVTAASVPALVQMPSIAITSVDGVNAPAAPTGTFSAVDVALPQGTANPVTVTIAATNTPVGTGTAVTLKLIPQTAAPTTIAIPAVNHTGTFASSTITTPVTFPAGQVSVIQAWATMTLTGQIASLFPAIDGEPVERVMVAALDGGASTLSLVTKSGKERRVDQLEAEDQLKVALAWQALSEQR
jgi:hypothetical protein